jgi:hypothetical protein
MFMDAAPARLRRGRVRLSFAAFRRRRLELVPPLAQVVFAVQDRPR